MSRFIDLTGQRFGRLIVIERAENGMSGQARWVCRCDCGNEKIILGYSLRDGHTISCGCFRKETIANLKSLSLVGKTFGKLLVIEKISKNKFGQVMWECICECGNAISTTTGKLQSGEKTHCGCVKKISPRRKKYGEASFNALFASYKHSANVRNLSFELTKDEFMNLTGGLCFYCGIPPNRSWNTNLKNKRHGEYVYNGIDRIDNSIGYTYDNCVSCCFTCNYSKKAMSQQEFYSWIEWVYNHSILKGRE